MVMDEEGATVTLPAPRKCLAESSAWRNLHAHLSHAKQANLQQVLQAGQDKLGTNVQQLRLQQVLQAGQDKLGTDVQQLRVLHADESQPLLVPPAVARPPSSATPPSVAVVFWEGGAADPKAAATVSRACSALGVQGYARASVGSLQSGPAFVGLLHNAGLLVPALCRKPPPPCPTVSKSQLLAQGRTVAVAGRVLSNDNLRSLELKQSWLHTCSPHPRGAAWPLRGARSTEPVASTVAVAAPKSVASTRSSDNVAHPAAMKIPALQECVGLSQDTSDATSTEASSCARSEHAEELEEEVRA